MLGALPSSCNSGLYASIDAKAVVVVMLTIPAPTDVAPSVAALMPPAHAPTAVKVAGTGAPMAIPWVIANRPSTTPILARHAEMGHV